MRAKFAPGLKVVVRGNTVKSLQVATSAGKPVASSISIKNRHYAELFAAAPELYEALEELTELAREYMPLGHGCAIGNACAALRKARGGA